MSSLSYYAISLLSRLVSLLPLRVLELACIGVGNFAWAILPQRRRITESNLAHFYPAWTPSKVRRNARIHFHRLAEYGAVSLCLPHLSEGKRRGFFGDITLAKETALQEYQKQKGLISLAGHFCLNEAASTIFPILGEDVVVGAIYRPLASPGLDRWIKVSRSTKTIRLIARSHGLRQATKIIQEERGIVSIFFDQDAGKVGNLSLVANRLAASSPLPDLLQNHTNSPAIYLYLRRTGFFQAQIEVTALDPNRSLQKQAEALLEERLLSEPEDLTAWLWSHRRWKRPLRHSNLLGISHRKTDPAILSPSGDLRSDLPRNYRLHVRLPNWLGDLIMLLPLLRTFRIGRPDAEITLSGKASFLPLLRELPFDLFDEYLPLPPRGYRYWYTFLQQRKRYFDASILFTNSFRSDLESLLMGIPIRVGIRRAKKFRPLLTHQWRLPPGLDEARLHQTELWARFLRDYGWASDPDYQPLPTNFQQNKNEPEALYIGLFPGTENSPEKRWPVHRWSTLITQIADRSPGATFEIFGTPGDSAVAQQILEITEPALMVQNRAGQTDLPQLMTALKRCRLVVGNDTGGTHLANALGTPVVSLFGPTNSVRTCPIFQAPLKKILSADADPTGGGSMELIDPEAVLAAVEELLDPGTAAQLVT
ncbi:MAG: glycosyltransferase family 9 protein [Puniceicoccaceae bacterium]